MLGACAHPEGSNKLSCSCSLNTSLKLSLCCTCSRSHQSGGRITPAMDQSVAGAQSSHVCCQVAEAVSMQEAGRGDEPACHAGAEGKTPQLNLCHLPRVHCSVPSTWKQQQLWIQTGWEKQLVPAGRRGLGSSDRDCKTLGINFFLPQPSWCFLKLVKGAHRIQGSASGMPQAGWGDVGS